MLSSTLYWLLFLSRNFNIVETNIETSNCNSRLFLLIWSIWDSHIFQLCYWGFVSVVFPVILDKVLWQKYFKGEHTYFSSQFKGTDHCGGEMTVAGSWGSRLPCICRRCRNESRILAREWHHPQGTGLLTSTNTVKRIPCRCAQRSCLTGNSWLCQRDN